MNQLREGKECNKNKRMQRRNVEEVSHLSDGEDSNDVVRVSGKEGRSISRPGQREALWVGRVLSNTNELWSELIDDGLALQVEDLDARGGSGTEPVSVGREDQGVDCVTSLEGVEVLSVGELPEHGDTVLSTGSTERSIWGDGDGVDVTSVTVVVGL